jgi:hypothetical protein
MSGGGTAPGPSTLRFPDWPQNYRTSRNNVTSDSALVPFGHKGFADSLAVTLSGELL